MTEGFLKWFYYGLSFQSTKTWSKKNQKYVSYRFDTRRQ